MEGEQAAALKLNAPVLGEYFNYGSVRCSGWKVGPAPHPEPVYDDGPAAIIVVGTTDDPATPYVEAEGLVHQLDKAVLVTNHGEGHTGYNKGNSCVDDAVDSYLLYGTIPAHDVDCG